MSQPEFDDYSSSYEELRKDSLCAGFAGSTEFFYTRKRDLIRHFFHQRGVDSKKLSYLDVGCGKGELASLLFQDFAHVAGCDPSAGMLEGADTRLNFRRQKDPGKLPFDSGTFDFVTAVCVYHHVPLAERPALTGEIARVLRPGGIFAMIEHNPWNPATRIIVKRSPIDQDAILLNAREARRLMNNASLAPAGQKFFLYLPEPVYKATGGLENLFSQVPFGGQYSVFGQRS